ncbi:DUF998 domain-containing protein [Streptomyces chartreusis]|uniref:DUF998 domain-containing protein n=1 Tax=Streptomyces chartreusis TaxID=1969 RepID=UPI0037F8D682
MNMSHLGLRTAPGKSVRTPTAVTFGGIGIFSTCMLILHWRRADLSPVTDLVSEYALGRDSIIAQISFVAVGVSVWSFTVGISTIRPEVASRVAVYALRITSVGAFTLPFFPTDPTWPPVTTSGMIHSVVATGAMGAMAYGMFSMGLGMRKNSIWMIPSLLGVGGASVMAMCTVLMVFQVAPGLTERVLLGAGILWVAATSWAGRTRRSE